MSEKVNDDYPAQNKPMSDAQLKAVATAKYNAQPQEEEEQAHPHSRQMGLIEPKRLRSFGKNIHELKTP